MGPVSVPTEPKMRGWRAPWSRLCPQTVLGLLGMLVQEGNKWLLLLTAGPSAELGV